MADSDSTTQPVEIFDSLPYYDNDLEEDPTLREKVEHELARHRKNPTTLHPRVPPPYQLFTKNPLLQSELERVESHQPFPPIDTIRFQLPPPTSAPGTDEEWKASLDNARAQLEHQRMRQTNVSLLQTYGPNAWRIHNYLLEAQAKQIEKTLEDLKQLTVDVNRQRKNDQERLGTQLNMLETRWTQLISSVLQIEMANVALDGEIDRLNRREAEVAEMV
ncbi:breast carcinoma amplified sequence 2 [Dendrothele bispora CBS 962.96]|uniref:Breast carcinoma amplified sequence 2 n=1 Tax=Dendrothele bispora (strain CBS 962.96) TaxID=1314807 RepID=A0A4S8MW89_DENBC|nr:breast carcinoma amplified sequence 2 [Dendrothele bispora CBS 962.96]